MAIFFSADLHCGHRNIIKYCNRPFSSVEQMDERVIDNWNSAIEPTDTVYFLGDLSFGPQNYLPLLSGRIHFIIGNHDMFGRGAAERMQYLRETPLIKSVQQMMVIDLDGQAVVLCHYAMRVWHKSHFNSWHLYGHSHGRLGEWGKSLDVGVDAWDFHPVSWATIKSVMADKPDNPNYVGDNR